MTLMMMVRLIIPILLLMSCSPQKRLARLIKNNPEVLERYMDTVVYINTDSFRFTDTFYSATVSDTLYIPGDTIIETKYGTVSRKGDHFGFQIKPQPVVVDTFIIREIPVKGKVVYQKNPVNLLPWVLLILLILFMLDRNRPKPK
jgi:hypothetical protein